MNIPWKSALNFARNSLIVKQIRHEMVVQKKELRSKLYGTWALSGFNMSNAARIQPILDVEKIIANEQIYIDAIEKRQLAAKPNVKEAAELFAEAKTLNEQRKEAEQKRNENVTKVQEAMVSLKAKKITNEEVRELRLKGRELREEYRLANNKFNIVNDKLVNLVLSLPNLLDPLTPIKESEVLRNTSPPEGVKSWQFPTDPFWRVARPGCIGPQEQFAYGGAAWLELDLAASCQMYLLKQGFVETGNVDFVRRILLEGACLDPNQFLRIRENTVRDSMAHATYLVGGASFPAFLALFAQQVIYGQEFLPIKYFVIGRTYAKPPENATGPNRNIQSSAVQVFIACKTEEQEEEEFMKLASIMETFYARTIGLSFQSRLLSAPELRTYEKKKISFVLEGEEKAVGDLTTVGDYVSKRLLCCYADEHRVPKFLHMITGQFFDLSGFLRPDTPDTSPTPNLPIAVAEKTEDVADDKVKPKPSTGWKISSPQSGSNPETPPITSAPSHETDKSN